MSLLNCYNLNIVCGEGEADYAILVCNLSMMADALFVGIWPAVSMVMAVCHGS